MTAFRLYHSPMSTCSQKVRLVLAEKGQPFDSRVLDLRAGDALLPDYLALNPNGVVPTLVHHDQVFVESTLICTYLDDRLAPGALTPESPTARYAMRTWLHQLDNQIHAAVGNLTFAISIRHWYLDNPAEKDRYLAAIPDPVRRERRLIALEEGCGSALFRASLVRVRRVLRDLDDALRKEQHLAGAQLSIADFAYLPYLVRLEHLALAELFAEHPALRRWYGAMRARPSFDTAVEGWLVPAAVTAMTGFGSQVRDKLDLSPWPGTGDATSDM